MTVLKRNLLNSDYSVACEDVGINDSVPTNITIPVTCNTQEYGSIEGVAWIEEHMETWMPWWLALLFFWCIRPKSVKYATVFLSDPAYPELQFSFEIDPSNTIYENLASIPLKIEGIDNVWFNPTHVF